VTITESSAAAEISHTAIARREMKTDGSERNPSTVELNVVLLLGCRYLSNTSFFVST
jgi:hypothetical protein